MPNPQKFFKKNKTWVKLTVDPKLYPLPTIYSAAYIFLEKAYVYLDKGPRNRIIIWVFPKNKKENLNKLRMDFYNELLNYAHYFTSLKANAEALKMLMQKALFSAAPSLVTDTATKEIDGLLCSLSNLDKKH